MQEIHAPPKAPSGPWLWRRSPQIACAVLAFGPRLLPPLVFDDEVVVPVALLGAEVAEALAGHLKHAILDHGDFLLFGAVRVFLAEVEVPVLEGRISEEVDFPVGTVCANEAIGATSRAASSGRLGMQILTLRAGAEPTRNASFFGPARQREVACRGWKCYLGSGFMKCWIGLALVVVISIGGVPVRAQEGGEEGNEKALRYHGLLLRRPGSEVMFERFLGAWLDTGTKDGLEKFLSDGAKKGTAAEWQVLASYFLHGGRDEEALEALDAAVAKAEQDAELRITRAKLQARLLNFEAALQDLDAAGERSRQGDEASLRGLYLMRSGQPEEAVAAWKEILKLRPQDEELREDLIELEVAEGLYDEALATMEGLLAITKDPYLKAMRRMRLGEITLVAGQREEALKILQSVLASTGEGSWLEREVLAQIERAFVRKMTPLAWRHFM